MMNRNSASVQPRIKDVSRMAAKALFWQFHETSGASVTTSTSGGFTADDAANLTLQGSTTNAWTTYGRMSAVTGGSGDMYGELVGDAAAMEVGDMSDAKCIIVAFNITQSALPGGQESLFFWGDQQNANATGSWRFYQSAANALSVSIKDTTNTEDTQVLNASAAVLANINDGNRHTVMVAFDIENEVTSIYWDGSTAPVATVSDLGSIDTSALPTSGSAANNRLHWFARRSGLDAVEQITGSNVTGRTIAIDRGLIVKSVGSNFSSMFGAISEALHAEQRELPPILLQIPA